MKTTGKKPLFLILKKCWFDLIKSGEKKTEYRSFTKYWYRRLTKKSFDEVIFQLGYQKNAPRLKGRILNIDLGKNPRTNEDCFCIHFILDHDKSN